MANIRIKDLPADGAPKQTDLIPIDLGSTRHATVKAVVESGRPTASKTEAEAGVDASKAMTPLTTKQAIDAQVGASYVPKTVKVNAGSGMTGGGELSGDVTVGLTATNVDRLAKVDGIEAGAQVNTVTSVGGKTGAVTLDAADVGAAPDTLVPDINDNTTARHTHSNKAILDATTASFLAAEKTKLAGIAAGAQVNTVTSVAGKTGAVTLAKGDVGLGNVDNTSDASKPVSTATQTALNAKANSSVAVSAGTGLTGGGNLTANRSIALNAASIASLAKADTAIQAPGGTAGQVLAKSSATDNDVAWVSSEAATAVSYGPQVLTEGQQEQARENIGLRLDKKLRAVASPTRLPQAMTSSANTRSNSRQAILSTQKITDLRLVYCGWYVNSDGGEIDANPISVQASIEYPRGVYHRIKFNDADSVVIGSGVTMVSDSLTISIPPNEMFWVRTYQNTGSGTILICRPINSGNSDWNAIEAGQGAAITNKVMGGEIVIGDSNPNYNSITSGYGPAAIIGTSDATAIAILGDSKSVGSGDLFDGLLSVGNIAPGLRDKASYSHMGVGGDTLSNLNSSMVKRSSLIQEYYTHAILASGINDITAGENLNGLTQSMDGILNQIPVPTYICTIEPRSSSSDNWATLENQSIRSDNPIRVSFNERIRSGYFSASAGFFDLADTVESSRNSGLWDVTGSEYGFTADGTHPSPNGYRMQVVRGGIDVEKVATPNQLLRPREEIPIFGEFTPEVFGGSSNRGTCVYTYQKGFYQKFGKIVFFNLSVRWTDHTGTGGLTIFLNTPFDNSFLTGVTPLSIVSQSLPYDAGKQIIPVIRQVRQPTIIIYQNDPLGGAPATLPVQSSGIINGISGFFFTE